jgi:hypothetical protein
MGAWGAREARGRVPADAWGQLMALDAPERAEGLTAATSRRQGSRQRALDGVESWSRDPSQDASDGMSFVHMNEHLGSTDFDND